MPRLPALLALTAALALSACQQPAQAPAAAPSEDAAVTPVPSTAEMPVDAPPQEEAVPSGGLDTAAADTPCRDSLGETASARLVQRCIAVSPATRPPCNAANPCALIQGEIDRACGQYGPDETKPAECAA
ncbi:hypothetical protein BZG35_01225 [Brevundimonas sp. LM2]|uniref:hypothetical protein n=1 Tax=Brevundimonas sp. LM2 TaxID=1938605 RepID=UPI00098391C9|nr:hypothetical protein [Brevundimonas sp. LM2]AQR60429.1 hypothetical protein BZG35_01225 [Brevundimonas sp. LM2]